MEKQIFSIPNISCGHCTRAIENELKDVAGITSVQGNIQEKSVTIEWESPLTSEKIRKTLKEIGYPADD